MTIDSRSMTKFQTTLYSLQKGADYS